MSGWGDRGVIALLNICPSKWVENILFSDEHPKNISHSEILLLVWNKTMNVPEMRFICKKLKFTLLRGEGGHLCILRYSPSNMIICWMTNNICKYWANMIFWHLSWRHSFVALSVKRGPKNWLCSSLSILTSVASSLAGGPRILSGLVIWGGVEMTTERMIYVYKCKY